MPQSKLESQRRARSNEAAAAKQKQLESFTHAHEGPLTTAEGIVVPDNHGSLRAGAHGPLLAEDFFLRDKLAHFERERIPERVAFARGCGAHGYFEVTRSLVEITRAGFLQDAGARTPVFVRFSNLTGSAGSADTVRDMRGFAVKFYTRDGNWDLVGGSMPVFFVQDAMKFPDLVHAIKPEPHHGMPQAASAHDTFWDFASLMPESTHALMWLMSGRGLPRSFRMMDGFGIHTFRLVNAQGVSHFVKFHWKAKLGRRALLAEEARNIAGLDPDFLRRDLWDAIEQGCFPEWELALQVVAQDKAESFGIDLLDPTKLLPEELAPLLVVGKLVLNRNPEDFFAESEQVAFHPGRLIPGIEFTADPLLQGRLMSYTSSQMARLGGPNCAGLPINRPVCPVHSFHRDGANRASISQGRAAYEPSTLATGAEMRVDGGRDRAAPQVHGAGAVRTRERPASFDDHFGQASFFWNSVGPAERDHITCAFQHELSQVRVPEIRQRVVNNLAHVDSRLAKKVAELVGAAAPDAKAAAGRAGFRTSRSKMAIETAPSLALDSGNGRSVATLRVAVLVAPGVEISALRVLQQSLEEGRARCTLLGERIGPVATSGGQQITVDESLCSSGSVLFDAVIVPGGSECVDALANSGHALRFLAEAYRHGKTICMIGNSLRLLEPLGIADAKAAAAVPGLLAGGNDPLSRPQLAADFIAALARHRHGQRPRLGRVAA